MKTERKIFVYGSMSQGLVHFSKIENFVEDIEPAWIQASAYRLKVGYPVVLEAGQDRIPGQALTLKSLEILWPLLDEFHGYNPSNQGLSLYYRKTVGANLETETDSLEVYFLNPKKLPSSAVLIPGGDWTQGFNEGELLTQQLTERQRAYVQRLGSSSGREIVPIDLPLYRELMNLELIVDKGRRLALSKLGQEVFRYLA